MAPTNGHLKPEIIHTPSPPRADGVIAAIYYQGPMARPHYSPAWLGVTATPRRRAYGFRKRSGCFFTAMADTVARLRLRVRSRSRL